MKRTITWLTALAAGAIALLGSVTDASAQICPNTTNSGIFAGINSELQQTAIIAASQAAIGATATSGTGGFQFATNGTCIVPPNLTTGVVLETGACSTPLATQFLLKPSEDGSTTAGVQGPIAVGGMCLDEAGGYVFLEPCDRSPTQEWTWSASSLQLESVAAGTCVTGGSSGALITLATCSSGGNNTLVTPIDYNLMFVSGIAADCFYSGPHGPYIPPTVPASLPKSALEDYECLDVFLDLETLNGDSLDDFECNATSAQWLHFDANNHLETESGTCVTATGGTAGAAVEVEPCNGSAGQQWVYVAGYLGTALGAADIFGGALPLLCIDVQGESQAPTAAVVLGNCTLEDRPPGQQWTANLIWPANIPPVAPVIVRPANNSAGNPVKPILLLTDPGVGTNYAATVFSWWLEQNGNVVYGAPGPITGPSITLAPMTNPGVSASPESSIPLPNGVYQIEAWSQNAAGDSAHVFSTFNVGPGCVAQGQYAGSGGCCQGNLQKNLSGDCEPPDPPTCGKTVIGGAPPCCRNSTPCIDNGTCVFNAAEDYAYCSPNVSSTGTAMPPTTMQTGGNNSCTLLPCLVNCVGDTQTSDQANTCVPAGLFCSAQLAEASFDSMDNQGYAECHACCGLGACLADTVCNGEGSAAIAAALSLDD
jgi:hypothetical protein